MKALEGYVLGAVSEPEDKTGGEWKKWKATNSGILAWLLSSLTPSVDVLVEALEIAREVWDVLSQMYSGKGNVMLVSQLEDKVHDLTQGEKAVMTYVGELKQLWADLDHLNPLTLAHPECVLAAKKWIEDTIFVRAYEERTDLLRAVIMGPAGTPYHDGLFFFDIYFPAQYPCTPPLVNYRSGGLRLNPNLYGCGKVCLSLLNTWSGSEYGKWDPYNSTMLQVLVSIQALVLNAKPYFNEPGCAGIANTPHGEKQSLSYNEDTFLLSCRTMLYSLRNPPKNFEDFVAGHFCKYGRNVLVACKAYLDGAQVGCLVGNGIQDVDEGDKSCSLKFKTSLKRLFEELLMEFTVKGAVNTSGDVQQDSQVGSTTTWPKRARQPSTLVTGPDWVA